VDAPVREVKPEELKVRIQGDITAVLLEEFKGAFPEKVLEILGAAVGRGVVTLRPDQIDRLVEHQLERSEVDESALAMVLAVPVSQIKSRVTKAKAPTEGEE